MTCEHPQFLAQKMTSNTEITQALSTIHILSTLLSLHSKQQPLSGPTSTLSSESGETVVPRQLSQDSEDPETLKKAFLDRLAEVLSPNKGGKDVTATALKEAFGAGPEDAVVIVTRNSGLKPEDRGILERIEKFFRDSAEEAKKYVNNIDSENVLWGHLLHYGRARLNYYINQLTPVLRKHQEKFSNSTPENSVESAFSSFCNLICSQQTPTAYDKIVSSAYLLRTDMALQQYLHSKLRDAAEISRIIQSIRFLGRLRSAYETLRKCARQFPNFKKLRFECITCLPPQAASGKLNARILDKMLRDKRLDPSTIFRNINRGVFMQEIRKPRYIHCEVRLFLELCKAPEDQERENFSYIGVSRKSCFLCSHFLKLMRIDTRGTHGKVYPQWTVAVTPDPAPVFVENLVFALKKVEELVVGGLIQPKSGLNMVAESSAALTTAKEDIAVNALKKAALKRARGKSIPAATPSLTPSGSKAGSTVYKHHSRAKVLRLPADGSEPSIISVSTLDITDERKDLEARGMDCYLHHVPDLRRYWTHAFKMRDHRQVTITNNDVPALNGKYLVFFIIDEEFPRNQTICAMIRPEIESCIRSGELFRDRLFWCGDVFVVRLGDPEFLKWNYANYDDIPTEMLQIPPFLVQVFEIGFKTKHLESNEQELVSHRAMVEEHRRKKDLVLARMTPLERERVLNSPMGNTILEYKAITEGDINALKGQKIEPDPNNPEQLIITQWFENPVDLED
ncbi:hypothetical protein K440DRAFT_658369 [Wilcoxina mikolae CBS 423.85]|nr:hypothetical protein K440DRAFT_658369 [Wilcoxina mikolae CBS 423.85]